MNLKWHSENREDVVAALRGGDRLAMYGSGVPEQPAFDFVSYAVNDADDIDDRHVSMVLLGNERKEFFSWVATYAEDVFPVSMCARVLHRGDWDSLHLDSLRDMPGRKGSSVWASVVLGELLGQSAGDIDVSSVPIGRALACFSYAIARTELLYPGNSYATAEAAERLALIERDARLGHRVLGVEALSSVWAVPKQLAHLSRSHLSCMDTVLKVVEAIDPDAGRLLRDVDILSSDFAEHRVEGFDALVDMLLHRRPLRGSSDKSVPAALAAAALMVGRGTSHLQLLGTVAQEMPQVFAWFGVLAGILGPEYWDLAWTRSAKSVERLLSRPFRLDEPVQADLCWAEFEWMSETYAAPDIFNDIPKSTPRSLAVEVLPGVDFQFRLTVKGAVAEHGPDASQAPAVAPHVVDQALKFLEVAQSLLRGDRKTAKQSELFDAPGSPTRDVPKAASAGRGKGRAGKAGTKLTR